jgi:thioredoxin reductase (NADPH)
MPDNRYDCLIVGGGPAGLLAAVYLARYRRKVVLFDDGASRAKLIPESHNYPGYTGISGERLLAMLGKQAAEFGVHVHEGRVGALAPDGDGFRAQIEQASVRAARVLMATGIIDHRPAVSGADALIDDGLLRFCPVCDAYEATDSHIGVLGPFERAYRKALFLRTYTAKLSLLLTEPPDATAAKEVAEVQAAGVRIAGVVQHLSRKGECIAARLADGMTLEIDTLYPALGADVRSELATAIGARANKEGCLIVDEHQRLSVPGLYAAGDVVSDLSQISVGFGHAAVAATDIHNSLPRNDR